MYDCVLILLAGTTYGISGGWVVTFVRLERFHQVYSENSQGIREPGWAVNLNLAKQYYYG